MLTMRGAAVKAGALHVGTVALGERIVEDQQDARGQRRALAQRESTSEGGRFGLAAKGCQDHVIVLATAAWRNGSVPIRS